MGVQLPRTQITVPTLADPADMPTAFGVFATDMERHFVNRFADRAARDAAITQPVPGMFTYRADGKVVEYYDGNFNDWIPLHQSSNGVQGNTSAGTTTSSTFVDIGNSFSFTKHSNSTVIIGEIAMTVFVSVANTDVEWALNINNTDYLIMRQRIDFSGVRDQVVGAALISGVPAGTYTVSARWRRESGTGTVQRSTGDWISISATEVVSFV